MCGCILGRNTEVLHHAKYTILLLALSLALHDAILDSHRRSTHAQQPYALDTAEWVSHLCRIPRGRIMRQGQSNVQQPIQTSNFCRVRNATYEPGLSPIRFS